jgi:predicted secreted protein
MAVAGKSSLFKVSATAGGAGSYTTVAEGKQASMKLGKQALEYTYFGESWRDNIDGLKETEYEVEVNCKLGGDTNGQDAIMSAFINTTELWVQLLWNGSAGYKQRVIVTNVEVTASVDGVAMLKASFKATGAAAAV